MSILCAIPLISSLMSQCAPVQPLATGYVEGEYVLIAPVVAAQVEEMGLRRGQEVKKGEALVQMERRDAAIALAEARSALKAAEAQRANLSQGRRQEEIEVIEATLASARAQAEEIAREAARVASLVERSVAPQAQLDEVQSRLDVARARVAEVEANLAVARLPARAQEIAAADAQVGQAQAGVQAAQWQFDQRTLYAPAAGRIIELLRHTGEIAGPQAPVLSMLPEGAVFIRLYVPETAVSKIEVGSVLEVNCDGCGAGAEAVVSYISDEPEFTPPVIYSLENRQKLVFMVEARPQGQERLLKPGQIVDAVLPEGAE